jgi:hypothetical protein
MPACAQSTVVPADSIAEAGQAPMQLPPNGREGKIDSGTAPQWQCLRRRRSPYTSRGREPTARNLWGQRQKVKPQPPLDADVPDGSQRRPCGRCSISRGSGWSREWAESTAEQALPGQPFCVLIVCDPVREAQSDVPESFPPRSGCRRVTVAGRLVHEGGGKHRRCRGWGRREPA